MKKARYLITLVLLVGAFLVYQVVDQPEMSTAIQSIAKITKTIPGIGQTQKDSQLNSTSTADSDTSSPESEKTPEVLSAELRAWLRDEASKMDQKEYDTLTTDNELQARAQKFGVDEISVLKETALDSNAQANERILSTYILSLASGTAFEALGDVAKSQLSKLGLHPAHSLDETQSMHEKAVKRMALDELFRRAQAEPKLRPTLYRYIQNIAVPELKAYGERRYQELFNN